ncbi:peptidylprolyl isomerase [Glaciecola sp. KUL10]|uniref:peptidylprolyl isomerase n=1 Tax=Glaciecola sp. (strain KUL10) TaxID=2161813 RepID=UPI000D78ADA7|nr:peptidylprolyl isomerase [Glaciecola sp. KUL10]GBL05187.1 cyclophilin type peptidyl-prolyl cis-trans isomerase [Glaciecola sp. KUL10]
MKAVLPSLIFILSLSLFSGLANANKKPSMPGENIQKDNFYPRVKFETTMGNIVIELERRRAPITVNNFLSYVVRGEYDNTVFHRIVPNYIVQGGGYDADYKERKSKRTIYNESGNGLKNDAYTISMARKGDPHSAIRQFFFNAKDNDNLNPGRDWGYTVFGSVIEGTEVIDAMSMVETEYKAVVGFRDAPVENIMLKKASLLPEA